ncbi:unnamed protein product [Adineta steineri]|uniref:SMP-30/Gluconolactonase/LRE-like region domain-containing protein n=1 Tax=Adineta steineri TaxID=433720 RepID=A0A818SUY5_9BILA|nr:unnamed protein product [Adineta steineri]CAF3672869.1 unnamed protein product [Adineta steineri]
MNMNNRVGVDECVEVNSDTTRLQRLCAHSRKKKIMWIIILIICIDVIITIPAIIITRNKKEKEKISTATEITTEITTTVTTTRTVQILPSIIIDNNTKWKQNAVTVAGGNGWDSGSNQLNYPYGIYIDNDDESIYIADAMNHRIVRWELDAKASKIVAGGNGRGNRIDQLDFPADVILDKEKKYVIICDNGNKRVVRWSRQNSQDQQIWISSIMCRGFSMDNNGDIYISDMENYQVRRFQEGDSIGKVVAGGNDHGDQLNQLSTPTLIFVDEYYTVYVTDSVNNRVMKWKKNATEGIRVTPKLVSANNPNSLHNMDGMIVDHVGNVYVSNFDGYQITRWSPHAIEGTPVVGDKQCGSEPMQLKNPHDISFDRDGNLYIVDTDNHRIQKFIIDLD